MPIYEFVCPTCGQSFEKLVRGGRRAKEAPAACPTCGQDSYRKEVSLVAAMGSDGTASLASSAASCAPSG
jgi:putative FmdB family regulatory protein